MPTPPSETEVIIVGAGPVGLTLACELERHGVSFRIIDKSPAASTTSKALALHARSLEMLHDMGLVQTFIDQGLKVPAIAMHAEGKQLVRIEFSSLDSPFNFILDLPQNETEGILADRLTKRGITIERSCELQSFEQDDVGVTAVAKGKDGEQKIHARYLVGCDGSHSKVRHVLELPFIGKAYDEHFILADVHVKWALPMDEMHAFFSPDGMFVFFPMKGGRFRIVATVPSEDDTDLDLAYFEKLIMDRNLPEAELFDPVWFSHFKIHHRKVPHYRDKRVFVAGDAAHIHSPIGGQGMNTGMQDAYNLGWKLALALQGKTDILESYNAEREPVGREVLGLTDRMTTMATVKHPLAQAFRNKIMPIISNFESIRHRMRDKMEEVDIEYAHSPIISEEIAQGLPADVRSLFLKSAPAGVRACDGTITEAVSGAPHQLYDIFRTKKHVLMLFTFAHLNSEHTAQIKDCVNLIEANYGELVQTIIISGRQLPPESLEHENITYLDPRRSVHEAYGVTKSSALILVRPDNYIGFRSLPVNVKALEQHLKLLFT